YFLIPRERFKNFFSLGAIILFMNLFVSLAWSYLSVTLSGAEPATIKQYLGVENVDVAAQKTFILEHPAEFLNTLIFTINFAKIYYLFSFMGVWGTNGEFYMPPLFYVAYGMTLIFFALTNGLKLRLGERGILIFASGISVFACFLFDYLIWAPVGAEFIRGVQGRYFIPIALMIFAALKFLPPMKHKNLIATLSGIFSGAMMLLANFFAFY
ncbi:MAG: DUF2142 domain-containing protein, partial [Selenomonadaceae bacterium]|nr:DUF2142 domain-containing protein [Selenomonadaceae bacterium]